MSRLSQLVVGLLLWPFTAACGSASSGYVPRYVARGELTLRYDDGLEIHAGKRRLTDAPAFGGLADYTRCVPRAFGHAQAAESDGSAAIGTGIAGSVIAVSGLGGLAGLAFLDTDKPLAFSLLGTGVGVGLLGMSLALVSRALKNSANGHAVDAVNFYNDEVGFYGGSCDFRPPAPEPAAVAVPAAVPLAPVPAPAPALPPSAPATDDVDGDEEPPLDVDAEQNPPARDAPAPARPHDAVE